MFRSFGIFEQLCLHLRFLQVPLDYSDTNSGKVVLALIRIPSTLAGTDQYRGPVMYNPGGPSESGVQAILDVGELISQVIGPEFDVISFDPRGGHKYFTSAQFLYLIFKNFGRYRSNYASYICVQGRGRGSGI